ncbi:MAG: hypothetical protein PHQ50_06230 [Eubacteriales bacterium]|nr:hypothetical protein [Eubacteriales bacterium]
MLKIGSKDALVILNRETIISKHEIIISRFETIVSQFETKNRSASDDYLMLIKQSFLPD